MTWLIGVFLETLSSVCL